MPVASASAAIYANIATLRHALHAIGKAPWTRTAIGGPDEDERTVDDRDSECESLWRTKKSHFQPSVKSGIKNIDKNNR